MYSLRLLAGSSHLKMVNKFPPFSEPFPAVCSCHWKLTETRQKSDALIVLRIKICSNPFDDSANFCGRDGNYFCSWNVKRAWDQRVNMPERLFSISLLTLCSMQYWLYFYTWFFFKLILRRAPNAAAAAPTGDYSPVIFPRC